MPGMYKGRKIFRYYRLGELCDKPVYYNDFRISGTELRFLDVSPLYLKNFNY